MRRPSSPPRPKKNPTGRLTKSLVRVGLVISCAVLVAGCAHLDLGIVDRDDLAKALEDRGIDSHRVVMPYQLTPEMRQWADDNIPDWLEDRDKLKILRDRLLDPNEMSLSYAWGYTGTAMEVFEERRANCLAFTFLFVGMARHLGVPVYFLRVENVETFRRRGDLVVVSDHIAVGHGDGTVRMILDFSQDPQDDPRFVHRISDLEAIAMFHSNRGAEALQRGNAEEALPWLRVAVRLAPDLANSWVNLGVAVRRLGDEDAAEMAYKRALERDPSVYSAYQNLAALMRHQGRVEEAEAYESGLVRAANENPYTFLALGDISLRSGRLEDAERFYRRAVRLTDDDADVYAALGHLALAAGDEEKARKWLRRAERIRRDSSGEAGRLAALRQELRDASRDEI